MGSTIFKIEKMKYILELLRINHWYKNIAVLIGIIFALLFYGSNYEINKELLFSSFILILLSCLLSSANYIINAICDIEFDKNHPQKKDRPLPSGRLSIKTAYITLLLIIFLTLLLSFIIFKIWITIYLILLLIAALIYNIKPIRLKDIPYIDSISESVNNPIRFLIGWSLISYIFPNIYLLLLTWLSAASLMTIKRLIELKNNKKAGEYRKVFKSYTKKSLIIVTIIYMVLSLILGLLFILTI